MLQGIPQIDKECQSMLTIIMLQGVPENDKEFQCVIDERISKFDYNTTDRKQFHSTMYYNSIISLFNCHSSFWVFYIQKRFNQQTDTNNNVTETKQRMHRNTTDWQMKKKIKKKYYI